MPSDAARRRTVNAFDLLGVAIGVWALAYPHPHDLCIAVLVVAPVAAIAVAFASKGQISLNDRRRQKRPAIGSLMLVPWIALGARALFDYKLIDWVPAVLAAVAVGGLAVLAAVRAEKEFRTPIWVACLLAFGFAWGWGLVTEANGIFDRAPRQVLSAKVVRKWSSTGRSKSFYVDLGETPVPQIHGDVDVDRGLYRATTVGEPICIQLHDGSLGWRWYRLATCDAAPALTFAPPHAPFRAS